MKIAALMLTVFIGAAAAAQTIHIVSLADHIRDRDTPSFSQPLHTKIIKGRIGDRIYTLEEAALFAYPFEIGKDYPVLAATDKTVKIQVTDKKGRKSTERLIVRAIEEVADQR